MSDENKDKPGTEEFKLHIEDIGEKVEELGDKGAQFAEKVIDKIWGIIKAGNVRRIKIKKADGETVFVIPVMYGIGFTLLAPILAAAGAVIALLTECTIVVEKKTEAPAEEKPSDDPGTTPA